MSEVIERSSLFMIAFREVHNSISLIEKREISESEIENNYMFDILVLYFKYVSGKVD